jgi:hypothetical protein
MEEVHFNRWCMATSLCERLHLRSANTTFMDGDDHEHVSLEQTATPGGAAEQERDKDIGINNHLREVH